MSKQTAVEWLWEQMDDLIIYKRFIHLLEKAKAMEKEQIVDAVDGFPLDKRHLDGEQYYNETYKNE